MVTGRPWQAVQRKSVVNFSCRKATVRSRGGLPRGGDADLDRDDLGKAPLLVAHGAVGPARVLVVADLAAARRLEGELLRRIVLRWQVRQASFLCRGCGKVSLGRGGRALSARRGGSSPGGASPFTLLGRSGSGGRRFRGASDCLSALRVSNGSGGWSSSRGTGPARPHGIRCSHWRPPGRRAAEWQSEALFGPRACARRRYGTGPCASRRGTRPRCRIDRGLRRVDLLVRIVAHAAGAVVRILGGIEIRAAAPSSRGTRSTA